MLAPMYINTNLIHQKSLKHSQSIHNKKLQHIKNRKIGSYFCIQNEPAHLPLVKTRWNSVSNCKKYLVRSEEIKLQNLKILEKLLDISTKRSKESCGSGARKQGKSLNLVKRKKDEREIWKDNQKIVDRIVNRGPDIDIQVFDKEYKKFVQCKKRISRFQVMENRRESSKKATNRDNSRRKLINTPQKYISPCLRSDKVEGSEKICEEIM